MLAMLDSWVVPQTLHGSSFSFQIRLCITKYSSISFFSPVPVITVFLSPDSPRTLLVRLWIDRILTIACRIATPFVSKAARLETIRDE